MKGQRVVAFVAAAGLLAGACATSAKQINGLEVIISADHLTAPTDFNDIKLEVSQLSAGGRSTKLWDRDYEVPSVEATLPTTFTLLAGQSPDEVVISVTAYKGAGTPVVQRVAQVQVPTDRLAALYLVLAQVCEGYVTMTGAEGDPTSTCPSGQSCLPGTGMCGSNVIATPLPTYTPGQSLDAGAPADVGGSDSSATDGTSPDAGCSVGTLGCSGQQPQTCTAGSVWQDVGAPCAGSTPVCANGACVACAPGSLNPVACGNCGTDSQTCVGGAWQSSGTCAAQGCTQGTMQSCNTLGMQMCTATCTWGGCSCPSAPACAPGAVQCSGNGVQTCDPCGQWGAAAACASSESCTSGGCATIKSCQTVGPGTTTCPGGTGSESCCASLEVTPNGAFYRTYANSGTGPTGEADPATVSGFRLDKYLVTVGRFRQFVSAWNGGAGYTPPAGSGKHTHLNGGSGLAATGGGFETGWLTSDNSNIAPTNANLACAPPDDTWTNTAGSQENLPVNCTNWYESLAFCIWDGGFLPSEAEWEYAAAGGSQQRQYPWGETGPGTANQYAIFGCNYPAGTCIGLGNIAPVGFATGGAGLWGQLDLLGDVWEASMDSYAAFVDPCADCANLVVGSPRAARGGGFNDGADLSQRRSFGATTRGNGDGLRCARTP